MSDDDGATRKVKAVKRKTPIADQATRRVQAVKRKPKPVSLGLLPEEAMKGSTFRFLETNLGWGFKSDLTTDRYEIQLNDRTPVLQLPPDFSLFLPGWHFDVCDMAGTVRFTLSLGLQKLVMRKLTVCDAEGSELGRIEQRFSLMEVKFDIVNPDGSLRFEIFQPAEKFTVYEIREKDFVIARISKDRPAPMKGIKEVLNFEDAFRVDLESKLIDERDRVLIIAAAIFMDRVFHTTEDQ